MSFVFLAGAIVAEVIATLSLRAAEGFSKWPFVVLLLIGYPLSFWCLSGALDRGMALGVAYGIWCAIGIALVTTLSIPFFDDHLTPIQLAGIVGVILSVVAIELGAEH